MLICRGSIRKIGESDMEKLIIILLKIIIFVFVTIFIPLRSAFPDVYDTKIIRIIDGDTVVIAAPYLPAPLKPNLAIRVYGVDTPEKGWRGKCEYERMLGMEASKFTEKLVLSSKKHQVDIMKWDKFGGRVLGDIILDGKSLRQMLIENGYAREYYGRKKKSWCGIEV